MKTRGFRLYRPFGYFAFFAGLNAWMSWKPESLGAGTEWAILAASLILLWGVGSRTPPEKSAPLWERPVFPPVPGVVLALGALLALAVRLYQLTTIPVWPVTDEGSTAFFSIHLARHWSWNLFFGVSHLPPLFYWIQSLYFKLLPPSLVSLWLFPALASWATGFLGYAACRCFFPQSISFLWALGWAFSFWPLYLGRFDIPTVLVPFWECLCLFLLGAFRRSPSRRGRLLLGFLLGTLLASGFYLHFHWPMVALVVGTAFFLFVRSLPSDSQAPLLLAGLAPLLLVPLPLFLAKTPLTGAYLNNVSIFHGGVDWGDYFKIAASYLTGLFWGVGPGLDCFAYRPLGGGFLNPLLGAAFLIGWVEMARRRNHPWIGWMAGSMLVFSLPVFLTRNLEMFRWIPILPLMLWVAALGLQALGSLLDRKARIFFLASFWALSSGLDLFRLAVVYPSFWKNHPELWDDYAKQRECYDAYRLLEDFRKGRGPGFILTGLINTPEREPRDQSLVVACTPFDAGRSEGLDPAKAGWAAVFALSSDIPSLRRSFPHLEVVELGPDLYRLDDQERCFLVLLPVDPENLPTFQRWNQADQFMEEMTYEGFNPPPGGLGGGIQRRLAEKEGLFQGDPFLEPHYWAFLAGSLQSNGQWQESGSILRRASRKGLPPLPRAHYLLANLAHELQNEGRFKEEWGLLKESLDRGLALPARTYYLAGFYLFKDGQYASARQAYLTAARMDPRFMPPPEALRELDRRVKQEKQAPPVSPQR